MFEQSINHGTNYRYRKGCRCDKCVIAMKESRKRGLMTSVKKHGTTWGYEKGCRCKECIKAKSDYWHKQHPDAKPPTTDIENQIRKCIYCNEIKSLEYFPKNRREFLGRAYDCKLCHNKRSRENKNTPQHRYSTYKSSAKVRNIKFDLSFEEFNSFWNKSCYYCGTEINGIGLDRKDPKDGYNLNNIVPCCAQCNRAKTIQTTEEFISMCKKVAKKFENYIMSPK